jgi:hypothetical protein
MAKSTNGGKVNGKLGKWHILHKSPPTGQQSMGNWENEKFYRKVCAHGKHQWETGKMTWLMEKSTHRGNVNGNWENDTFYGKVHPQGKGQWEHLS